MAMAKTHFWLYESANGRIPKELRKFFAGVEEYLANANDFGRPYLTQAEIGKLTSHLKVMATHGLDPLKMRQVVVPAPGIADLLRLKVNKRTHNPRFYFTDAFEGYFVFFHALKKDHQDIKQHDLDKAQERLSELQARGGPS